MAKSDAFVSANNGRVCGIKAGAVAAPAAVNFNGQNWAIGCDFKGNDIATITTGAANWYVRGDERDRANLISF